MSSDFMDKVETAAKSLQSRAEKALNETRQIAFLRLGTNIEESQNVVDDIIEA